MTDTTTIAVFGATGAQGGGLADAVLSQEDSPWRIRAITRDPSSTAAKALAERGAEVVQADINDLDSLRTALEGAGAAFCMTNFWEHFSGDTELRQAKNLAAATADAGVDHVVWSTFSDTRKWLPLDDERMPVLQEHYNIPHFDAKGAADDAFDPARTTFMVTSFYWDNFIHFGMGPQRTDDGSLAITFPMGDVALPGIGAADIGPCALGILEAGERYRGHRVGIAGAALTGEQMADAMSRALDQEVRYQDVPADAYRSFGFDGADELGNMFQFKRDFSEVYLAERDVEQSRQLHPGLADFDRWLADHAAEIPMP